MHFPQKMEFERKFLFTQQLKTLAMLFKFYQEQRQQLCWIIDSQRYSLPQTILQERGKFFQRLDFVNEDCKALFEYYGVATLLHILATF